MTEQDALCNTYGNIIHRILACHYETYIIYTGNIFVEIASQRVKCEIYFYVANSHFCILNKLTFTLRIFLFTLSQVRNFNNFYKTVM